MTNERVNYAIGENMARGLMMADAVVQYSKPYAYRILPWTRFDDADSEPDFLNIFHISSLQVMTSQRTLHVAFATLFADMAILSMPISISWSANLMIA